MDVRSQTESLKNLLEKNNTTTSLSANLKKKVGKFLIGLDGSHENLPLPYSSYPAIIVEVINSDDNFGEIGNNARRDINLVHNIVGITHYGIGSGDEATGRENADKEAMELSTNIETLIREKISLSSTVQWCRINNANYSANRTDKTYNSIVKIQVTSRIRQ